jgi:hypothetical protein
MTAQVLIKLSSKLAAEQGLVGGFDGTMDSRPGASDTALGSEDAALNHSDKSRLSRGTRRASWAEKNLKSENTEKSKKRSFGNTTSSMV